MIREVLLSTLAAIPLVLAIAWLTTQFQYRITRTHLEVTLFGFVVRRLPLTSIRAMSTRRLREGEWGEQWWNTLKPSRRFLTLKLHSGFFRYFVLTPNHRYIFKAELKQAIGELRGGHTVIDETETDAEAGSEVDSDEGSDFDQDSSTEVGTGTNPARTPEPGGVQPASPPTDETGKVAATAHAGAREPKGM